MEITSRSFYKAACKFTEKLSFYLRFMVAKKKLIFCLFYPAVYGRECPPMDEETRRSLIQVANISSMGIALGVTIFGCFFIGYHVDRYFGTSYFFTFLFLLLGIAAGFKNIYGLIKRSLNNGKPPDKNDKSKRRGDSSEQD